ncbi:MAG: hypothetical protein HYY95_06060 [Candidatus Rokubacteria bacterium]|nr:hypothetical protein [Candidatus Rokubacteria bacterium]
MNATDLCYTPATELASRIRDKALSPVELTRAVLDRTVRPLFETYSLLLTPSVSVAAFPVGRINPEHYPQHPWDWLGWASFSYPLNFTGQPAASVPAGFTPSGMPVGLQIVGRRFADLTVLQASAAFEQARPWARKRPPVQ